ncbi:hypothetical protein L486_00438 [Kwoniella mangroviensis CBS 10435]|uniref:Uncharacterized protein n=1 Tax=Kwoniella mangroviensis CBS 10435 TaxID=1331196 RepID=A0A1B9IZ41_9TREE|nr:hypothetical protein L486_00438 [Kwoniella mangroviensis CBS 10435]
MRFLTNSRLFGLLALLTLTRAEQNGTEAETDTPYFTIESSAATVYYDLKGGNTCSNIFGGNWSVVTGMTGPDATPPACEWTRGKSLTELDKVTPIAMNNLLVDNDLLNWCGRIVNVYKADGTPYVMDSGPFFIWDGCEYCGKDDIIDMSAEAIIGLQDQIPQSNSGCDNPQGLRVEVTNDYYWKLQYGGNVIEDPTEADKGSGTFGGPVPTAVTTQGVGSIDWNNPTATEAQSQQVSSATAAISTSSPVVGVSSLTSGAVSLSQTGAGDVPIGMPTSIPQSLSSSVPSTSSGGIESPIVSISQSATTEVESSIGSTAIPSAQSSSASGVVGGAATSNSSLFGVNAFASDTGVSSVPTSAQSAPVASSSSVASGNAVPSASGQLDMEIPGSEEADCEKGTYSCNGLQLRICGDIQSGSSKIGWIPTGQCPTQCEAECGVNMCN